MHTHKIVNGVSVDLSTGEAAAFTARDANVTVARAYRMDELRARFRKSRDAGTAITVSGVSKPLATSHDAFVEIQAMHAMLTESGGTQAAVTRAGDVVTWTTELAAAALNAVRAHHAAANAREAALCASLKSAETVSAVNAIDLDTGWPEQA